MPGDPRERACSGELPRRVEARRDLEDLFLVIQIFSYPGDYVRLNPTVERVAETLMKCEEDILGVDQAPPRPAPGRGQVW